MASSGHEGYAHATTKFFGDQTKGPSRLGGPEAWSIWVLATVFVVWLFAIQTGYGIVSPEIQRDAHLSISQISSAASVYTVVFAFCQFFSGSLLDRYGTRPLLAIAVALTTVGAFLFAATSGFGTLVLAQAVLAIGASFGFVGAGYVGGKWFAGAKYGLMFGLVQMFASLGSAIGQPVISALLHDMSWKQLLAGFGTFGVLLTVAFVLFVRNPVQTRDEARAAAAAHRENVFREIIRDLGACFANRQVVLSALFAGASFGTMLAVGVLWGPRVQEARGASAGFAAILSAMAWLGLAFGAPLVNLVSNRWHSRKWPAVIGLLLQTVAVALFIYGPNNGKGASVIVMFAVGLFAGTHMLGFTIAGESVSAGLIGSASAIVNGICFIVGGILEAVPGTGLPDTPDIGDFHSVLWIMPAVLLLGAVAALFLKEPAQDTGPATADPAPAAA